MKTIDKKPVKTDLSLLLIFLLSLLLMAASCKSNRSEIIIGDFSDEDILTPNVLTKEEQDKLSPQSVIDTLIKGNKDFIEDNLTIRNNSARIRAATLGQYPMAAVLSCLDSRVPVEDVFHRGIGDLFVARVAGNVVDTDILGSLEYACKVSGSKLIVVLGHEHCGAINAAIDDVKMGNLTFLLDKIQPAVSEVKKTYDAEPGSQNLDFVHNVCEENIRLGIKKIRESSILKEMEFNGEIMIVGAVYNMKTGQVDFML